MVKDDENEMTVNWILLSLSSFVLYLQRMYIKPVLIVTPATAFCSFFSFLILMKGKWRAWQVSGGLLCKYHNHWCIMLYFCFLRQTLRQALYGCQISFSTSGTEGEFMGGPKFLLFSIFGTEREFLGGGLNHEQYSHKSCFYYLQTHWT